MAAAFDDDDLSLSITPAQARRSSKDERRDAQQMPPPGKPSSKGRMRPPTTVDKRLDQYSVEGTLGEGSFGKVKLATHKISGQKVALKMISRAKLVNRDMAGRIDREISYLQLLRHPHIIKLFTVIKTQKDIVMVLEYAGGELFDYIVKNGKMKEDKARRFFQQIICAVEYCHRHKIVHRDLKPENLLLDDQHNVKIADFGLSNIITDGNFLKTSCGSPNYAAPEVISGKLYAGPEVDVWSCGVILYVLVTGKLPFDDDYIPALFKKIQRGVYESPQYLSPEIKSLMKRMLQVNGGTRATIAEIRQDPWFTEGLPEYLKPAVEDFLDTGVDPNKAIDPSQLGPKLPVVVKEAIHKQVVGKLGKTMGYATDDVQEALAKEEPSAIKDAYMIVRENTVMKGNKTAILENNPNITDFFAASPPAFGATPNIGSLNARFSQASPAVTPLTARNDPSRHSSAANALAEIRSPATTIGVLNSSRPDYHKSYMEGRKHAPPEDQQSNREPVLGPNLTPQQMTAARARLSPHARGSQINLQKAAAPEGMTPANDTAVKKAPKPTKWQFGIRSRNSPSEAMLAIFKALKAMGAVWEEPTVRRPGGNASPERDERSNDRRRHQQRQHEGSQSPEYSDSDPDAGTDPEYATREERERRRARRARGATSHRATSSSDEEADQDEARLRRQQAKRRSRGRNRFGPFNDWGYKIPEDPWIINARFRKAGMYPPGVAHPSSTHSSRADLHDNEALRRRSSTLSSHSSMGQVNPMTTPPLGSTHASAENFAHSGPAPAAGGSSGSLKRAIERDESCWVYMTIQLYCIEKDSYMVDFKCAGYERLVKSLKNAMKRNMEKARREEEVTRLKSKMDAKGDDALLGSEAQAYEAAVKAAAEADREDEEGDDEGDIDEGFEGMGRVAAEKDISSPFPFMDVASSLIVQLAQGD